MYFATILTAALVAAAPTKRETTCQFPSDKGLVSITSSKSNAGWALSPDQKCTAGSYCPYACPPGKLMAQWDSSAKSYSVGSSMNGGLYCNDDGEVSKPFSDKDYCVDGTGTVQVNNKASSNVAFCQTVLPGNEAMLIPTNVDGGDTETLAVPDESYYASSAAHYYINPLGVSTDEGCVWGTKDKSVGNWAPYVTGANTDSDGRTFLKIGWNPKYIDDFKDKPSFGIRITCDGNDCDDNSCEIDPSKDGYNGISGGSTGKSLGASYCVVTAKDKKKATIEVFSV
ncbi:hypothetical protein CJJ07_004539 [Candidozyma auris]|nr:hypothetical protein CJJ07_004539 [[Candida] auris]QEL60559.1 hypothetical protein CJJ09_002669 [[Candida] auris]